MSGDDERRQRAVMATDAEWERIVRAAAASGMDRSRFVVHRALMPDVLPAGVLRRAVREILVLSLLVSLLEEKRLREAGILCQLAFRNGAFAVKHGLQQPTVLARFSLTSLGVCHGSNVPRRGSRSSGGHTGSGLGLLHLNVFRSWEGSIRMCPSPGSLFRPWSARRPPTSCQVQNDSRVPI